MLLMPTDRIPTKIDLISTSLGRFQHGFDTNIANTHTIWSLDIARIPTKTTRRAPTMTTQPRMAGSASPHVALIVETSHGSGREILEGIAQYVREHGPWSIYHEPRSLEDEPPTWLRRWQGDGIIARLQNHRIAEAVRATGLPVVDVLGVVPDIKVPFVRVDNVAVGRMAAEYYLDRGFKNFAFVGVHGVNWSQSRHDAFCSRLAQTNHCCAVRDIPLHTRSDSSWEAEQDRLAEWLGHLARPVAIMVCNDPVGQRVLEACCRASLLVPDEAAVIGVDNDRTLCAMCDPPLSSVIIDHRRVGYDAATILDAMICRHDTPSSAPILPLGVASRQSTDVLAIDDPEVALALRFIREHAGDPITVENVLAGTLLSRSVLQRRFRALLGRTIHEEITRVRIKRASELLTETDLPIAVIAVKVGFGHQEYLGAVFKAAMGETPHQHRKRFRT